MSQVFRLVNIIVRTTNYTFENHYVYLQTCLRKVTTSSDRLQVENAQQTKIDTLPNYLKPYACQSAKSVFSFMQKNQISMYDTVGLLKALRVQMQLNKTSLSEIQSNLYFDTLCKLFVNNCGKLPPSLLVSGLRSMLEIGISPETPIICTAETVIYRRVYLFNITDLIGCLHLHSKYLCTDKQKPVLNKLVRAVQNRYQEINTTAEVLMLIQLLHLFETKFVKILEEKIIEIMAIMDTSALTKVFTSISEKANRNKTLLVATSLHLRKKQIKPNMRETVNILHALNSLNYFDCHLLSYLTDNLESDIASVDQPSLISSLLTVCGHLKWRHEGILDVCGQWISDHFEICSSREFVSFVLTTAALNYVPRNASVMKHILSHLTFESIGSKDVWLDVVWSLAVLKYLTKEMLVQVLSPNFHQSLLENLDFRSVSTSLKLLNLKSVLKKLYPEYVFSCDLFLEAQELLRSKESEICRTEVLNALQNLTPMDKYLRINLTSDMGVFIDAEFIRDRQGKPLSIDTYGLKTTPGVITKPLPPGSKRIALMIWLFRDYTLNDKTLIGANALAVELLSDQGYVVVQVPYEEFVTHGTVVKKVVYLSQLINEAIANSNTDA